VVGLSDRGMITSAVPTSQGISETSEESAYAAAFEAALSSNYQHLKRSDPDAEETGDRSSQKAADEAKDDDRQDSEIPMQELNFKVPQILNRVSLVNWEDEWDGGAFVEGEDAE